MGSPVRIPSKKAMSCEMMHLKRRQRTSLGLGLGLGIGLGLGLG